MQLRALLSYFTPKCPRNHKLTFRGSTSEVLSYPACTQAFLPSYLKVKLEKSRIINFLVRIFLSKKNFSRAWQEVAVLLKLLAALKTHCQKNDTIQWPYIWFDSNCWCSGKLSETRKFLPSFEMAKKFCITSLWCSSFLTEMFLMSASSRQGHDVIFVMWNKMALYTKTPFF